ncbi:MAG: signal recognition particle-docking protein FtsY [Phycisphaerales bacterium]|nr:signal recognition particle-docking protein FtsY [Phycisphaerales bacterium]
MAFKSILSSLRKGLHRTRESFVSGLRSMLRGRTLDDDLIREIEKRLIQSDVGVKTTRSLIEGIRADHKAGTLTKGEDVLEYLKREIKAMWPEADRSLRVANEGTTVILVTGVNGVGKTTSIAKLCHALRADGKTVLLGACDTFRAGAVRQLEIWADRLGVEIVKGQQGGDPAAVAFDACAAAKARGVDYLIIDTAGRLQTQNPLMRQLTKIRSVIEKQIPGAPHEVLQVLDATTGQNAIRQAEEFKKAVDVTGLVLTKLDGTAKGGVIFPILREVQLPVKFIGVGEGLDDLQTFDPDRFVAALFDDSALDEVEPEASA